MWGRNAAHLRERFGAAPSMRPTSTPRWSNATGDDSSHTDQTDSTSLYEALRAADASFDAVFDFRIIHHVSDWQAALSEVVRAFRRAGVFRRGDQSRPESLVLQDVSATNVCGNAWPCCSC